MPSVITNTDGRIVGTNPQQRSDPWVYVRESDYIEPTAAPSGYEQTRYLKDDASGVSFDAETATMGSVHTPIVVINTPETIPNDGSTREISYTLLPNESVDATVSIADTTTTATLNPSYTETVSTTANSGSYIDISISGSSVIDAAKTIEVISA